MTRYPDAYLEHYADRFVALRLSRHGVTLPQYLANIARFERLALEPEPLLPAQHAAVLRLWHAQDTGLGPRRDASDAVAMPENRQDWRELLERWRAEADAAERELEHLPQRNGTVMEPLRHKTHHGYCRRAHFVRKGA